ncbi:MAG: MBOAT family protein, partial [Firmicutes bacterium]|nr:MBOAT family protein [Bacillota bacterium]
MVFSSMIFLYGFLPLHILAYFAFKKQTYRDAVLLISSMIFYAWGEPVWISLLLFSGLTDYVHGLIVEKYRGAWQSKAALISSIVLNLFILGFFKYSAFLIQNVNALLQVNLPYREFALPIGISFYTFQTMSYVIDVYRGEVPAQKSPWKFLLYVSLFHQLVAGPIVRYSDIAHDIEHRHLSISRFSEGITRFVLGLSKKVILANTAGEISELLLQGDIQELPVLGAWFGISLFALLIY